MPNMTKKALSQIQSLHDRGFVSAEDFARAREAAKQYEQAEEARARAAIESIFWIPNPTGAEVLDRAEGKAVGLFEENVDNAFAGLDNIAQAARDLRSALEDIEAARRLVVPGHAVRMDLGLVK